VTFNVIQLLQVFFKCEVGDETGGRRDPAHGGFLFCLPLLLGPVLFLYRVPVCIM